MPKIVPYSHVLKDGSKLPRKKPWQAYRIREGRGISLGYFATRQEATEVEREFDRDWPPKKKAWQV